MEAAKEGLDDTSIKPVSSLLSRFEGLTKDPDPPKTPIGQRQVSLTVPGAAAGHHSSSAASQLSSPADAQLSSPAAINASPSAPSAAANDVEAAAVPRKRRPSPPRPRPKSMMAMAPAENAPPVVTVEAPNSPPQSLSIDSRVANGGQSSTPNGDASPSRPLSRTISRAATPALQKRMSAFLQDPEPVKPAKTANDPVQTTPAPKLVHQKTGGPPPVNRAAKPKLSAMSATSDKLATGLSKPAAGLSEPAIGLDVPEKTTELIRPAVSSFHTPPPSGTSSPGKAAGLGHGRTGSDASFVQHLRSDSDDLNMQRMRASSDASFVQRIRGESDASYAGHARAGSNASFVESSSLPDSPHRFEHPPAHHHVAAKRDQHVNGLSRTPTMPSRYRHSTYERSAAGDLAEDRPRLPVRPELQVRSGRISPTRSHFGRTSPPKQRSGRTSPSKLANQISTRRSMDLPHRANTVHESSTSHRIPAVKLAQNSGLTQGFDHATPSLAVGPAKNAPAVPAPRRSMDRRPQPLPVQPVPPTSNGHSHDDEEDASMFISAPGQTVGSSDFPDSSNASRRPPRYKKRPHDIPTDYDTRLVAVCGEYVCTTGYLTKAWSLRTGEQVLNLAHNESIKVTAIAFKPFVNVEDEGLRIWLGTTIGEIHEVDIPSQSLVKTKTGAHRRELVRIFRHASELWTLDDGGDLNVWVSDAKGLPNLDSQSHSFRTAKGHTFSIACGEQLWLATGKEIRVYLPRARSDAEFQVLRSPLTQANTGDVTSGATISSKPDFVYFGHTDGKVSIYNRRDFSCTGVVNVSVYKISSLAGVGDYLWAGYNTGMAYVYDTSTTPWKVKKDWHAHGRQICSIVADPSAVWKMDRLQVVTLGTDNMLKVWDGLLEEDWLCTRMQEHDSEYCTFEELNVAVLTWNAGASKPGHLQYNKQDDNFFRDYMTSSTSPPDIFIFGFQELVDLEDKKVTAKSFFKSKKKDSSEQEHMSHQYRAWRDHLTRCLEDYMPATTGYSLLHTASMVGLFTCVFVRSALRPRIKHLHTAEIKRGMGGLHGNKGALILRFTLDDSSLCFLNCHLAAGQTQTINRNNDIAAILESEALPPYPLASNPSSGAVHADVFTSGGDGSMVLDHEICILNGDLNYRIDTMGRDTVIKHIAARNLPRLLERDQLLLSRKKNPGFRLRAFAEHPITFAPTYKYNVQTDEYDTSEKRRAPAWCDRVLYRGLGKVRCEEYRRWEVRVSDHRPVSARLRIRVKKVQEGLREGVWEICLAEFEAERVRVWRFVQFDYLTNVLGMAQKSAVAALRG